MKKGVIGSTGDGGQLSGTFDEVFSRSMADGEGRTYFTVEFFA